MLLPGKELCGNSAFKGRKNTIEFVCARVVVRQCVLGRASRFGRGYTEPLLFSSTFLGLHKLKSLEMLLLYKVGVVFWKEEYKKKKKNKEKGESEEKNTGSMMYSLYMSR